MKKLVFKTMMLVCLNLILATAMVSAQSAEKEVKNDYSIKKGFTLGVENKYGNIEVVNWESDKLEVVVKIMTESKTQDRAEALLDKVTIEIEESGNSVYFETEYDSDAFKNNNNVRVNYTVKAPVYLNVELEQKYGNIYIQELTGLSLIEVKYGALEALVLENLLNDEWNVIELAYSNANVDKANRLVAELAYSGLENTSSEDLVIESKYSKLFLGEVGEAEIESKYDKVNIKQLNGSLFLESDYTQVFLERVSKEFKGIEAELTYGNFKGELEAGTSFSIDAYVNYGDVKLPEGNYEKHKEGQLVEVHGAVGSAPKASVEVELKYGNLILK